jgi:hypothetical protein
MLCCIAVGSFWLIAGGFFGEIADDDVKLVKIVTAEGLVAVTSDYSLMAKAASAFSSMARSSSLLSTMRILRFCIPLQSAGDN